MPYFSLGTIISFCYQAICVQGHSDYEGNSVFDELAMWERGRTLLKNLQRVRRGGGALLARRSLLLDRWGLSHLTARWAKFLEFTQ